MKEYTGDVEIAYDDIATRIDMSGGGWHFPGLSTPIGGIIKVPETITASAGIYIGIIEAGYYEVLAKNQYYGSSVLISTGNGSVTLSKTSGGTAYIKPIDTDKNTNISEDVVELKAQLGDYFGNSEDYYKSHCVAEITNVVDSGAQGVIAYDADGNTVNPTKYPNLKFGSIVKVPSDISKALSGSSTKLVLYSGYYKVMSLPYNHVVTAGPAVSGRYQKYYPEKNYLVKLDQKYIDDDVKILKSDVDALSELKVLPDEVEDIKTADYGAGVNLLKIMKERARVNGACYSNGIRYTVDESAGTIFIYGDQTVSVNTAFDINRFVLKAGKYIVSGCPEGGSLDTYMITDRLSKMPRSADVNGIEFIFDEDTEIYPAVYILAGYTIPSNGLLFKPMIRKAEITDSTYYPRIKTNQQLQEDVAVLPENAKKNYFNIEDLNGFTNMTMSDGVFTQTDETDTKTHVDLQVNKYNDGNPVDVVGVCSISEGFTGVYEFLPPITIDSSFDSIKIKHNGSTNDMGLYYFTNKMEEGEYILSLRFLSSNPSISGGIKFDQVMLRPVGTNSEYVPYMRSNLELTRDTDGVRGVGRNLLKITGSPTTFPNQGINLVFNDDGTIDCSGTRTLSSNTVERLDSNISSLKAGKYILSDGLNSNAASFNNYAVQIMNDTTGSVITATYNANTTFTYNGTDSIRMRLWIIGNGGGSCRLYPMIRDVKYANDPTFYPYSQNEIDFQQQTNMLLDEISESVSENIPKLLASSPISFHDDDGTDIFQRLEKITSDYDMNYLVAAYNGELGVGLLGITGYPQCVGTFSKIYNYGYGLWGNNGFDNISHTYYSIPKVSIGDIIKLTEDQTVSVNTMHGTQTCTISAGLYKVLELGGDNNLYFAKVNTSDYTYRTDIPDPNMVKRVYPENLMTIFVSSGVTANIADGSITLKKDNATLKCDWIFIPM